MSDDKFELKNTEIELSPQIANKVEEPKEAEVDPNHIKVINSTLCQDTVTGQHYELVDKHWMTIPKKLAEARYETKQQKEELEEAPESSEKDRKESPEVQEKGEGDEGEADSGGESDPKGEELPIDLTSDDRALRVAVDLRLPSSMLGINDVEHKLIDVLPIEHEVRYEDAENILHLPGNNQEYTIMSKYYADLEGEAYKSMCNANTIPIDPKKFLDYNGNKEWNSAIDDSYYAMAHAHTFYDRMAKGTWSQGLRHADKNWGICSPEMGESSGVVTSEEEGMYRIMDETGDGRFESIYLIHTGIWIKIKPPEADDILDYYRIVNEDKIKLGRHTYGRVFSNVSVIQERRAISFCLRHMVASSLNIPVKNIKRYISIIDMRDLGTILWGMAEAMYPDGFDYDVGCSADPNACNFIYEGTLNVHTLLWEDNDSLNTDMKDALLFAEAKSLSVEDVNAYKTELSANDKYKFKVPFKNKSKELILTLRHPTIDDKIKSGERWIDDCSKGVMKAFDEDPDDDQRNIYLNNNAKITYLRQYGMFIDQIKVGNAIIPHDKLDKPLKALSGKKVLREGIVKVIGEFIENNQLSVVGIPKFKCPKCHKEARDDGRPLNKYIANIIPMDPLQTFFTVTGMKIIQISEREL